MFEVQVRMEEDERLILPTRSANPGPPGHTGEAAGLYRWGGAHGEPLEAECSAREGNAFNQEGEVNVIAGSPWEGKESSWL